MVNKRFKYHPYLSQNYLMRGNGNYCMLCGRRMQNIRPGIGNAYQYWVLPDNSDDCDAVFLGYTHRICPDSKERGDDKISV